MVLNRVLSSDSTPSRSSRAAPARAARAGARAAPRVDVATAPPAAAVGCTLTDGRAAREAQSTVANRLQQSAYAYMLGSMKKTLLAYAETGEGAPLRERRNENMYRRILQALKVEETEFTLEIVGDVFRELLAYTAVLVHKDGTSCWSLSEAGEPHTGFARIPFANGDTYLGFLTSGQITGTGLYRHADGAHAYGDFKEGRLHGEGTLIELNEKTGKLDKVQKGAFADGELVRTGQASKKKRARGTSSTSNAARRQKKAKAVVEEAAIAAAQQAKAHAEEVAAAAAVQTHSYSFEVFTAKDIKKDPSLVPVEYLAHPVVCGKGKPAIKADDLQLIDGAVFLKAYMSPLGSADKTLIGCRQVAYFKPLNMIVLNTTVIFDAHQKQKNLDPLQKCTSDYMHKKYPDATRIGVVTSPDLSPENWQNYTTNGFPWNNGDGTYRYLKMINIDDESYEGGEHDSGPDDAWDTWTEGRFRNVKGYDTLVSGGYGQHGFTLVAMLPRDEELVFKGSDDKEYVENPVSVMQDTLGDPNVSLVDGEIKIWFPKDPTNVMGINTLTFLNEMRQMVPEAPMQNVVKYKAQWTMGNHPTLNGRTNKSMPRNKIFVQKGDPSSIGTRQYQYTGKQNRVDYMTCDVTKIPLLETMTQSYDASLPDGVPASNHYITTMYSNGTYCIDAHSDKDKTLDPESVISIVKLGPGSRRFIIREKTVTKELNKVLFDQVLPPGTIVQMTLKGNALTTHEVPREPDNTEMSGSVVFRTSNVIYTPEQVQKRVTQSDKNINTVIYFVDPIAVDSA